MRGTRARAVSYIGAGVIAVSIASCGNAQVNDRAGDNHQSASSAAFVTADLTKSISLAGGHTTIAPPGESTPQMTASQVFNAFQNSGDYDTGLNNLKAPQIQFGLYTNMDWGPEPTASEDFTPYYKKTPVWVITYQGVTAAPAGNVAQPDDSQSPQAQTSPEFFIISDKSGEVLLSMIDSPDSNPTPLVTPPPGK